jgi:hypothetical protein
MLFVCMLVKKLPEREIIAETETKCTGTNNMLAAVSRHKRDSSVRFSSSSFYHQSTPFGPLFHKLIFSNFPTYPNSKIVLRFGPLRSTNIFWQIPEIYYLDGIGLG